MHISIEARPALEAAVGRVRLRFLLDAAGA